MALFLGRTVLTFYQKQWLERNAIFNKEVALRRTSQVTLFFGPLFARKATPALQSEPPSESRGTSGAHEIAVSEPASDFSLPKPPGFRHNPDP